MKNFWNTMIKEPFDSLKKPRTIAIAAMLIALNVVFTRFLSFQTPFLRIGFGFLPVAVFAIYFGAIPGAIAAAVGDIIGFFLFSTGAFSLGFTLSAFLLGFIYGIILYNKELILMRIIIACLITSIFVEFFLNTYWLCLLLNQPFKVLFVPRVIKEAIMLLIKPIVIYFFFQSIGNKLHVK